MARKRYHQSKTARSHESRAMKLHDAERKLHHEEEHDSMAHYRHMGGAEHYAGAEPRRRQEMRDAGMIHEDHTAVANLPQEVYYKPYPKLSGYLPEGLDDTIRGVDEQIDADDRQRMKHFKPHKY